MDFRPHIMTWTPRAESSEDENDYPIEGEEGSPVSVPCRFHSGGTKQFRNENNDIIQQRGRIRIDVGSNMPGVGQMVIITEGDYTHFSGQIMEVYRGQLGWRCDV